MSRRSIRSCLLRHDSEILLRRRPRTADAVPGHWDGITGGLDDDPVDVVAAALGPDRPDGTITHVRTGEPVAAELADGDGRIRVVPSLLELDVEFPTARPSVAPTGEGRWLQPPGVDRLQCVPWLRPAYDRVAPSIETVAADTTHGAEYLSRRAVEVLRDRAAERHRQASRPNAIAELRREARDLQRARPAMAVVARRIDRVMYSAGDARPGPVCRCAVGLLGGLRTELDRVVEEATRTITADRVGTLSTSGTVRSAIERIDPSHVLVAESRPGGEGRTTAQTHSGPDRSVSLTADAAMPWLVANGAVDAVMVGADTVLGNGSVANKVGTFAAAMAGQVVDVPVYVLAHSDKITWKTDFDPEYRPLVDCPIPDGIEGIDAAAPIFDLTPFANFDGVITERGALERADIEAVGRRARTMRSWCDRTLP